jgi:hypothetical protein
MMQATSFEKCRSNTEWRGYFQQNSRNRMTIPWEQGIGVESNLRQPLIRSLQRFQVGEQGDGKQLRRKAKALGDPDYLETIELFIKEEQEHARLLACIIHGMDGELLKFHWSDVCFVFLRRLAGLHLELMVLLIAEMIAKRYYRALHEGTSDPVLQAVFAQIRHDENGHVAFHSDTLHRAFVPLPGWIRALIREGWHVVFNIVCLVVMFDHRSVLRAMQVSSSTFWQECNDIFSETTALIFTRVPASKIEPKSLF